jgi:hypothetical protein
VRRVAAAVLVALAFPVAAQAARFSVEVVTPTWTPKAGARWEYAVTVKGPHGGRVPATVFPQVFVGHRRFDSLGSHYTMLGIVAQPYEWSGRLRGTSGVIFQVTVYALGSKLVRRFPISVR